LNLSELLESIAKCIIIGVPRKAALHSGFESVWHHNGKSGEIAGYFEKTKTPTRGTGKPKVKSTANLLDKELSHGRCMKAKERR
jgi:hypothetical protein